MKEIVYGKDSLQKFKQGPICFPPLYGGIYRGAVIKEGEGRVVEEDFPVDARDKIQTADK